MGFIFIGKQYETKEDMFLHTDDLSDEQYGVYLDDMKAREILSKIRSTPNGEEKAAMLGYNINDLQEKVDDWNAIMDYYK